MARVLLAKARFTTPDQNSIVPPLGLMYIAGVLRQAGHEVSIFEAGYEWADTGRFRAAIEHFSPDVIGLSAITMESRVVMEMAAEARRIAPGVPVILGGPHASSYPARCLENPAIDHLVLGEGELTMLELVDALTRGGSTADIPGTATRGHDGAVSFGPPRATITDLDGLPFPAWDLIDVDFYARHRSMSTMGYRRYMPLFTSRGCPYRCVYCHEVQGKKFRARSPQNVLTEMELLERRYGIREFEIIDDIFNFDRDRMREILEGIIAMPDHPTIHFPNALRTDRLDAGQIRLLRRAGTQFLCVAVETAEPRLQRLIQKNLRLDVVRENIDIAVREGMFVNGFFMLGFPTETADEARSTVEFAVKSPLHQALFFIVTPFEGTKLYDMYRDLLIERGGPENLEDLDYFVGRANLSAMTDRELFGIQRQAYRRFYADPARMLRILTRHPRPSHLFSAGMLALMKALPRPRGNSGQHRRPGP